MPSQSPPSPHDFPKSTAIQPPLTPQPAPETWSVDSLRLTPVGAADAADLVRLGADPRVGATLGGVRSPAETHAQLARFQAHWQAHGFGVWAVRQAATGDFVGRAGFLHTTLTDPAFTTETVGLLYAIAPEHGGQGYARAIATALVTLALDRLQLPEISGWTLITHARSQRILAHAGLCYERRLTHWNLPHVFYRRARLTSPINQPD